MGPRNAAPGIFVTLIVLPMNILPHISSPYSEPWVAWVLCALLAIVAVSPSMRSNVRASIRSLFSQSERMYDSFSYSWGSIVANFLFRLGTVSMAVYLLAYRAEAGFTAGTYAKVVGITAAFFVAQFLLQWAINSLFLSNREWEQVTESHDNICTAACFLLLPVLFVVTRWELPTVARVLFGVVFVLFVAALLRKGGQLLAQSWRAYAYIILYIISLDVVPLWGILECSKHIV